MRTPGGTLAAHHVSTYHGTNAVSLAVSPASRIGVVGSNGIGKTTLLRVMAGLQAPDSGTVTRTPTSLTVGYLPQEPDARAGETLLGHLARRTGVAVAEREMDALAAALADDPALAEGYTEALERFLALGGDELPARAAAICAELGLPARLEQTVETLSGGEAARAALAAILLARFDVFLLDEPTNNLDFAGLERLERFVASSRGAFVVVSHDRAFLERAVDRIVELEDGTHRAIEYAGAASTASSSTSRRITSTSRRSRSSSRRSPPTTAPSSWSRTTVASWRTFGRPGRSGCGAAAARSRRGPAPGHPPRQV